MTKVVYIILFFLLGFFADSFSQIDSNVYKTIFDRSIDMAFQLYLPDERLTDKKVYLGSNLGDGSSYFLESLLIMYESTNETKYLHYFLKASNEVLSYRDDKTDLLNKHPFWSTRERYISISNTRVASFLLKHPEASIYENIGLEKKLISCPGPISYQNALILMPMAHFVYLAKKIKTTEFNKSFDQKFITFNHIQISNFKEYSDWLVKELFEINNDSDFSTYEYFDKYYWIKNRGYRQYANDEFYKKGNDVDAMDRNSNWGVVNTYLAAAFKGEKNESIYLNKSITAIRELKKCLNLHYTNDSVPYYQWSYAGWTKKNKYGDLPSDDISHAGAVIDLATLGFQFKDELNLKDKNGECYFSNDVMIKMQNTLLKNVYVSPLKFHHALNGSCSFYKWPNCEMGDFIMTYSLARWLRLSKSFDNKLDVNNSVYSIINHFYSKFIENPELIYSNTIIGEDGKFKLYGGSIGSTLLGIALSSKFSGDVQIVGRLSQKGIVEIATIKNNVDSVELIYSLDNQKKFYSSKLSANSKIVTESRLTVDFNNVGFEISKPKMVENLENMKNIRCLSVYDESKNGFLLNFDLNNSSIFLSSNDRTSKDFRKNVISNIKLNTSFRGIFKSDNFIFLQDSLNSIYISNSVDLNSKIEYSLNFKKLDIQFRDSKKLELIEVVFGKGKHHLIFYDHFNETYLSIILDTDVKIIISEEILTLPKSNQKYKVVAGDFYGEGDKSIIFIDQNNSNLYSFKFKEKGPLFYKKYELPIDIVFNYFSTVQNINKLKSDFLVGVNSEYGIILFNVH